MRPYPLSPPPMTALNTVSRGAPSCWHVSRVTCRVTLSRVPRSLGWVVMLHILADEQLLLSTGFLCCGSGADDPLLAMAGRSSPEFCNFEINIHNNWRIYQECLLSWYSTKLSPPEMGMSVPKHNDFSFFTNLMAIFICILSKVIIDAYCHILCVLICWFQNWRTLELAAASLQIK